LLFVHVNWLEHSLVQYFNLIFPPYYLTLFVFWVPLLEAGTNERSATTGTGLLALSLLKPVLPWI
jgi:hypothetical protein